MKILGRRSWKNLSDMVANEHLGKCVKVCLTDIQVSESQSIMETRSGKYGFLLCKCRFLILFLNMNYCIFSSTGLFLFRETSFQQILLSSSGLKENIFPSKFIYTWSVSENIFLNVYVYNIFSIFNFYKTDVIVLWCDRC